MVTYDDLTADVWYIAVNLPEMSREPNDNSNQSICVIVEMRCFGCCMNAYLHFPLPG